MGALCRPLAALLIASAAAVADGACTTTEEGAECRLERARKFAPLQRFDMRTVNESRCFPDSPVDFYNKRMAGNDGIICSNDYSILERGEVPVYFRYTTCGEAELIIYQTWYSYQQPCIEIDGVVEEGYHHTDWEKILVLVKNEIPTNVKYHQHAGAYTRVSGEYEVYAGTHPVLYVGKNSHGSYHDNGGSGGCMYFQDFRNPGEPDYKLESWRNLVDLTIDPGLPWTKFSEARVPVGVPSGNDGCESAGCWGRDDYVAGSCLGKVCGCWKSSICDRPFNITVKKDCSQGGFFGTVDKATKTADKFDKWLVSFGHKPALSCIALFLLGLALEN